MWQMSLHLFYLGPLSLNLWDIFIKEVIRFQALLSVADPEEWPGGPAPSPPPPLFLDQTEARGAEKNFSGDKTDKTAHEIVSTCIFIIG